ncbi:MAG: hypothetical protein IIW25_07220 [Bacteroidales bacterium]|nr:hypothetical protein [Bacteroidales bacterium]
MANTNNIQDPEINVGEALSKTEKFFETYKKHMLYGIAAIVIVAAAIFAYYHFIHLPKQRKLLVKHLQLSSISGAMSLKKHLTATAMPWVSNR